MTGKTDLRSGSLTPEQFGASINRIKVGNLGEADTLGQYPLTAYQRRMVASAVVVGQRYLRRETPVDYSSALSFARS